MRSVGLLALAALIVLAAAWFALRGGGAARAVAGGAPAAGADREAAPAVLEAAPARPGPAQPGRAAVAPGEVQATDVEPAAEEEGLAFLGRLVLPDRTPVGVDSVRATLTPAAGPTLTYEGSHTDTLNFVGVRRAPYTLEVQAEGYSHRPWSIDLATQAAQVTRGVARFDERVVLWPAAWIPIVVRTRDGRPFPALAQDEGLQPKRLFVHAFQVGASRERPAPDAPPPAADGDLARFRPPPGYQSVELPGGVAGSLELLETPPFWVGLWVNGVLHDAQVLEAGASELAFELEFADLERGMATVRATLVDRDSGAPVVDAVATLKADTSAHRRADLSDVAPDEDGRLTFARVMPGQHELSVRRGANLVQRRLELAPGEERDLGEVAIGAGPGVELRVVDVDGNPVSAWVEIAPYERGRHVEELYPPNLHRCTQDDGLFELPVPDRPSIVRVRPTRLGRGGYREYSWVGSQNHLLDPDRLPRELVIVAQDPVEVRVEPLTPWDAGHRLTAEDALGLVVDFANGATPADLQFGLIPGDYTVRRWAGSERLGSVDVRVTAGTRSVACP